MLSFIVTALFSGVVYLLLTAGSGPVLRLWSSQELLVAVVVAVCSAGVAEVDAGAAAVSLSSRLEPIRPMMRKTANTAPAPMAIFLPRPIGCLGEGGLVGLGAPEAV